MTWAPRSAAATQTKQMLLYSHSWKLSLWRHWCNTYKHMHIHTHTATGFSKESTDSTLKRRHSDEFLSACCSMLQCVAVRCSVLQCVAVCCSVLQCLAVSCSVLCISAFERSHLNEFHYIAHNTRTQPLKSVTLAIYIHTYIYIYTHTCIYIHIYIYIYVYIHIYICVLLWRCWRHSQCLIPTAPKRRVIRLIWGGYD